MTKKLALETKICDAALSLFKVNASHKRVSQQTTDQLNAANSHVESAQKEYWSSQRGVQETNGTPGGRFKFLCQIYREKVISSTGTRNMIPRIEVPLLLPLPLVSHLQNPGSTVLIYSRVTLTP
jgi:hypothetical protein